MFLVFYYKDTDIIHFFPNRFNFGKLTVSSDHSIAHFSSTIFSVSAVYHFNNWLPVSRLWAELFSSKKLCVLFSHSSELPHPVVPYESHAEIPSLRDDVSCDKISFESLRRLCWKPILSMYGHHFLSIFAICGSQCTSKHFFGYFVTKYRNDSRLSSLSMHCCLAFSFGRLLQHLRT